MQSSRLSTARVIAVGALIGLAGCKGPLANLQRGCDQGSGSACLQLGNAYYEGKDAQGHTLDLNYFKARKAFDRACDRDNAKACYNLGFMKQHGEGGDIEKSKAAGLYKKACELGDAVSCGKGAAAYRDAQGTAADLAVAAELAKRGCEKDDKDSCELAKQLGSRPAAGDGLTPELRQLAQSCDLGASDACFQVGVIFDEGKGIAADKNKAAIAYKAACEKSHDRGCHRLGVMLVNGEGITRDIAAGIRLLNQGCDKGLRQSCEVMLSGLNSACVEDNDADACTLMGRFFVTADKGLPKDMTKGVAYLRRGCKLGDKDGCNDLKKLGLEP